MDATRIPNTVLGLAQAAIGRFRLRPWPLSAILAAFGLAIAIPVLVFSTYVLDRFAAAERANNARQALDIANSAAQDVDRDLLATIATLQVLASSPSLTDKDYGAFHKQASLALNSQQLNVVVRAVGGQQLVNTRLPWSTPLPNEALPEIDSEVSRTRAPYISNLIVDMVVHQPVYMVTVPVLRNRQITAFLHMTLDLTRLTELLRQPFANEGWTLAVSDRRNIVMARSDPLQPAVGQPLPSAEAVQRSDQSGVLEVVTSSGQSALHAYQKSSVSGWTVTASMPIAAIEAPLRRSWWLLAGLGWTLLFLSGLLALGLGRVMARPLRELARAGAVLGSGQIITPSVSLLREANEVSAALANASIVLHRHSEALNQSEFRVRAQLSELERLYDAAPIGLAIFDRELRFTRINRRLAQFTGHPPEQHLGCLAWEFTPTMRETIEPLLRRVLTTGESCRDLKLVAPGRNGLAERDWLMHLYPVTASDGTIIGVGAIVEDATERERGEQANAMLAAIVNTSADAIISVAMDGTILTWNPGAERLLGYSAGEAVGMSIAKLYPSGTEGQLKSIQERVLAGEALEQDTVRTDKAGNPIDVSINITAIRGAAGQPIALSGIIRDIRQRKEREKHVHFIMRELSHRTKNLLAIIQSIARQTAASSKTLKDFEQRFTGRLHGLAHSHDLLVKEDWSGVAIEDLVRTQLAPFIDAGKRRLTTAGPRLWLKPQAAQPIGLALHELATNASKYGALSVPNGRVSFSWSLDQAAGRVHMAWREIGGPPVVAPASKGFGHVVIERLVAEALDSSVSIDFAKDGMLWSLDLPASHLSDRQAPRPFMRSPESLPPA